MKSSTAPGSNTTTPRPTSTASKSEIDNESLSRSWGAAALSKFTTYFEKPQVAFVKALKEQSLESLQKIFKKNEIDINAPIDEHGETPLHYALLSNNIQLLSLILSQPTLKVNQKVQEKTALYRAVEENKTAELNALLLHPEIDVNQGFSVVGSPLHCAVDRGHTEIITALLKVPSLNVNSHNNPQSLETSLHTLAQKPKKDLCAKNDLVILKQLLSHAETDCQAKDAKGATPLHYAAAQHKIEMVKVLLAHPQIAKSSTAINISDKTGASPLHKMIVPTCDCPTNQAHGIDNVCEGVQAFFEHEQINFNSIDHAGKSPLYQAIENKKNNIAKFFLTFIQNDLHLMELEKGSKLAVAKSVLLVAATSGDIEMVKLLLAYLYEQRKREIEANPRKYKSFEEYLQSPEHENFRRKIGENLIDKNFTLLKSLVSAGNVKMFTEIVNNYHINLKDKLDDLIKLAEEHQQPKMQDCLIFYKKPSGGTPLMLGCRKKGGSMVSFSSPTTTPPTHTPHYDRKRFSGQMNLTPGEELPKSPAKRRSGSGIGFGAN